MADIITVALPARTRQGEADGVRFLPATADDTKRTIDLVWTTGAQVLRLDWSGWEPKRYIEELVVTADAVDLSRLNNGAPLLDSHGQWSLSDVFGVVERAWLEGGQGMATVRFSEREEVAPFWRDVKAGIIRNVSVGYRVKKYMIEEREGQPEIRRAVEWEPVEISLVPIGADPGAGTRSDPETYPCIVERAATRRQENPMSNKSEAGATDPVPNNPPVNVDEVRQRAIADERARQTGINQVVGQVRAMGHELPAEFVGSHLSGDTTVDVFRTAALDHVATAAAANPTRTVHGQVTADEAEKRAAAVENALMHRFDPGANKLDGGAREYRGLSLIELGRTLAERAGEKTRGLAPMELAGVVMGNTRAAGLHGTSDFPQILANTANKVLRAAYAMAPRTFMPFSRRGSLNDFKPATRLQIGEFAKLEKVNESGEFKRGTVSEAGETIQLATYGKVMGFTRQALINDDLDAFLRVMQSAGFAAANLESDIVWGIITTNSNLADGGALFNTTALATAGGHANLAGSGAAIGVDSLSAGRAAMRKQKSLSGYFLNLTPSYLIVPTGKEGLANQYTSAQFVAAKSVDINPPYNTSLEVIVEPRLDDASATAWYLAASPGLVDTIEYAYLNGQEGVYTETRVGFDVDGLEIKARHDFAAKAIDYRGLYKNPGA